MSEINVTNEMINEADKLFDIYGSLSAPLLQRHLKITSLCAYAIIKVINDKKNEINNN